MKLRSVPVEVFDVMGLGDDFNYLWIPDSTSSLVGLGASFLLEFFEFYGEKVGEYYDEFIHDPEFKDERFPIFITQEKRHAAAHRKLNAFMAKKKNISPDREKYHPRVYDFMYPTYKEFVEPILSGIAREKASGKTVDGPSFKEALKSIGVFESEVCMSSLTFFDNLIDNGRLELMMNISQNLGVLYLLGYHYIEEMEHCSVSIEAFERIYNETLWTRETLDRYTNNDILSRRMLHATLHVAKMFDVEITTDQIVNSMAYQTRAENTKKYIKEGFTANTPDIKPKIEYLIERWDTEWEPMLLAKIKQKTDLVG